MLLTWRRFREAVGERVSCISFRTSAHWRVIYNIALGSCAARSRTRVATPLPHAGSVAGTFRVNAAFGSAVGRYAHVISQARARRGTSDISALGVGSARRRRTRVRDHGGSRPRGRRCKNKSNLPSGTSFRCLRFNDTTTTGYWRQGLRGMEKHLENGSPVKPWRQAQIGLWLITSQRVLRPHGPGHGSTHFWFTQALF
jgi:hypothetical protein